ncbi:hypothetical protein AVEN_259365-1 [Araneus ventricosus]|uniref:Uncharacterized protein n=1 Tax=Araneus ventricosus TaxID=182803 RepID=A0A4Y2DRT7_ARAVE|nr:hypothetical protein AVEN_259365-1 [Araneus ventricosus]
MFSDGSKVKNETDCAHYKKNGWRNSTLTTVFQARIPGTRRGNLMGKRSVKQGQIMVRQRISPQSNHITRIKELHHPRDSNVTPRQPEHRSWLGKSSYCHRRK